MVRKPMEVKDSQSKRQIISTQMIFDCHVRPAEHSVPNELILLLHGYSESGNKIFSKLQAVLPSNAIVVAPNGPFPIPYEIAGKRRVGFSWYFYDSESQEYFIDMTVAVDFLDHGIKALDLSSLPKRIIGFSQGGYLAPFVAQQLGNVTQVIGIGCEFLVDEFPSGIRFRIDGIQGEKDEITSTADARSSHLNLNSVGIPGELHLLPETGHRIDSSVLEKVKELLNRSV